MTSGDERRVEPSTVSTGRHPPLLDLAAVLWAVDRAWPGWEFVDGRPVPAPWGFLVGVESSGTRLVHRPLDAHPVHVLQGWSAPEVWCAVGVAVRGTAHRTASGRSTGPHAPAVDRAGIDARVIWVCHRDGRSGSLLGLPGEPVAVVVTDSPGADPDEGRVPRLLRQALDLTPPADLP